MPHYITQNFTITSCIASNNTNITKKQQSHHMQSRVKHTKVCVHICVNTCGYARAHCNQTHWNQRQHTHYAHIRTYSLSFPHMTNETVIKSMYKIHTKYYTKYKKVAIKSRNWTIVDDNGDFPVVVQLFNSIVLHRMLARPIFGEVTPHLLQQATGSWIQDSRSSSRDHSATECHSKLTNIQGRSWHVVELIFYYVLCDGVTYPITWWDNQQTCTQI